MLPGLPESLFSRMAHRAGLSVSATTVESRTATVTVTANSRYRIPVMPGNRATGMNTAASTSDVAISAPVNSSIAWMVASRAARPSSFIRRSTFSTTTMASSTTIPMTSTRASRFTVFRENPITSMAINVPITDTGTASEGISVVRQSCRNR